MEIPKLKRVKRSREYSVYERNLIVKVVYAYIFEGKSNREIDNQILNIDSEYSHGWQSMGILHYLGIQSEFKGIFKYERLEDVILEFEKKENLDYQVIAGILKDYRNMKKITEEEKGKEYWLISANCKLYRHAKVFEMQGYIDWKQKVGYKQGDYVYIYCTKPDMKIMFKTMVEKVNMQFNEITDDKEYWIDVEEYEKAKGGSYCRLKLIRQVNTNKLSLANLKKHGLKIAPQGPMRIKEELLNYINMNFDDYDSNDYFVDVDDTYEGTKTTVTVNKYERSSIARNKCIEYHGCKCCVCGIDFGVVYGDLGKEFIHVHHVIPISSINKEYKVDYKNDLVPICPNCHAMVHRKVNDKNISIEQLKRIYAYYNKLNHETN